MLWRILITSHLLAGIFIARPFFTSDTDLICPSRYEIEFGAWFSIEDMPIAFELKHGLTNRMNFALCSEYCLFPDSCRRFSPLELNMKYSFLPDLFVISVNNELGTGNYNYKGILGRSTGAFYWLVNAGLKINATNINAGSFFYALCGKYKAGRFCIGLEIKGDKSKLRQIQTGMKYRINDVFVMDVAISSDLTDPNNRYGTAGFSAEF
jgi:hypothetical protein